MESSLVALDVKLSSDGKLHVHVLQLYINIYRAVIQRQDTKCRRPGSCEQEVSVRKMCRACRYKKCLDIGMSKEALQPRRDLIGCRRFTNNRKLSVNSNGDYQMGSEVDCSPVSGDPRNQELLKLIQKLTASDEAVRAKKFEMIRTKMEAKKLSELSKNASVGYLNV